LKNVLKRKRGGFMRKVKKRVLVFASGDAEGGGSGFQELVEQSWTDPPILDAKIVGVISNHSEGGVYKKAKSLGIPFEYWPGPFTAEDYQMWEIKYRADFIMCSGWLKLVKGLHPARTVNIHPGPLPRFGGPGMYGYYVHEAVIKAFHDSADSVIQSAVSMHFVDEKFDHGPVFFKLPVFIRSDDTPDSLAKQVNEKERAWQSKVLNLVVNGYVKLIDGEVFFANPLLKKMLLGV
jgi:folate-dependent phosphoribosylglycinamide formyltransferase PurN